MIRIKNYIKSLFRSIFYSIAFYPSLLTVVFIFLAILAITLENFGISEYFAENIPYLVIQNAETARSILTTMIAAIISLMVFSFSMVMVVLNQAASNFTPRLLPGLISDKRHQIVLGIYLGTIIYSILILINILPDTREYAVPGFSIFLAMMMGIICLIMFVFFIHSISTAIQISTIIFNLFDNTRKQLKERKEKTDDRLRTQDYPDTSSWTRLYSPRSGYVGGIALENLASIAKKHNTQFRIVVPEGMFVLEKVPLFLSSTALEEDTVDEVLSCFQINKEENNFVNFHLGFKHLTEIIVKAMSPGINDPGTAITGIDYLTVLFSERMHLNNDNAYADEEGHIRVFLSIISFGELLHSVLSSIRQYTKHDPIIVQKLLLMLRHLLNQKGLADERRTELLREVQALVYDARAGIDNPLDGETLEALIRTLPLREVESADMDREN